MKNFSREKATVIFLAVFFICFVVLFAFQLRARLTRPFAYEKNAVSEETKANTDQDTDNDGLSDYQELNEYGTSPYLEDTDSDGISDKEEIAAGSDPTCPQGQNCQESVIIVATSSAVSEPAPTAGDSSNSSTTADSAAVSAAELRQFLLENNIIDQETLSQISDEDILASYQQALANSQASSTE
jgi:cbb3-type cytochrome oxidase subunit 3